VDARSGSAIFEIEGATAAHIGAQLNAQSWTFLWPSQPDCIGALATSSGIAQAKAAVLAPTA
jgi:hypothetical protein